MKTRYIMIAMAALLACSCSTTGTQSIRPGISETMDKNERYIQTYYPVAVEQMKKYGIPASITLAQGLLESSAGTSKLATEGKNHFGIKADSRWSGKSIRITDNGKLCEFRKYNSVDESFRDHSEFLAKQSRYSSLFKLDTDDYRGWAKGLKKAGYAEDSKYPEKLISLIERYNLQAYDNMDHRGDWTVHTMNKLPYIFAREGDRIEHIATEFGISKGNLKEYNDMYNGEKIYKGEIIFLKQKKGRAAKGCEFHTAEKGESLHSISQMYGVRLKDIYRMNPQYKSYTKLKVGDIIRLR